MYQDSLYRHRHGKAPFAEVASGRNKLQAQKSACTPHGSLTPIPRLGEVHLSFVTRGIHYAGSGWAG